MTNSRQQPTGSGFGPAATIQDVLADTDLTGRTAVVTGGYSGLGLATTRAFSEAGARVIVPARRPEQAGDALSAISAASVVAMDLADLRSVEAAGRAIADTTERIDVLINAAGVMAAPERRVGPGWESHLAINHLGHFALTQHLWPLLAERGARVVSYSSGAHHISAVRWHDPDFHAGYERWQAYGQSKTANVLFAVHLDRLGRDSGVYAYSVHPGSIRTPLQRYLTLDEMVEQGWIDTAGQVIDPTFKTPDQGAATGAWAATAGALAELGGVYCEDADVALPAGQATGGGVAPYAIDPDHAQHLWRISVERTGLNVI